jgi:hypothetical protein
VPQIGSERFDASQTHRENGVDRERVRTRELIEAALWLEHHERQAGRSGWNGNR